MESATQVNILLKDKLRGDILKDVLADSRQRPADTLETIFDIGLAVVGTKVADRCPRLKANMGKWVNNEGDSNVIL